MARVALAQIEIFDKVEKNVNKILDYINKASNKKAEIICFPESTLGDKVFDLESKEIKSIQKICENKSIYCIFGAHLKKGGKVHNSAILINRKGNIQYVYNKINLFPGLDLKKTSPGNTNKVINTDFGKIGIIICWDFAFPEGIKKLSKKGAQMIFCPSYLINDAGITKEVFRSYPLTRAFENVVYFLSCDAFTSEVLGESYICSPLKTLKKIRGREGIIFADLDLKELNDLKEWK